MKVQIDEGGIEPGIRHSLTVNGWRESSTQATLVEETEKLGKLSITFTYLIFEKDANVLTPDQRKQKVINLDVAEGGTKVALMTQDSKGKRWKMVTNLSAR